MQMRMAERNALRKSTPSPVEGEKEELQSVIDEWVYEGMNHAAKTHIEQAEKIKALEERLDDIDTFLASEEDAAHGDYGRLVTHLRGKILDKLKH